MAVSNSSAGPVGVSVPTARVSYEGIEAFIEPLQRAAEILAETILDSEGEPIP